MVAVCKAPMADGWPPLRVPSGGSTGLGDNGSCTIEALWMVLPTSTGFIFRVQCTTVDGVYLSVGREQK